MQKVKGRYSYQGGLPRGRRGDTVELTIANDNGENGVVKIHHDWKWRGSPRSWDYDIPLALIQDTRLEEQRRVNKGLFLFGGGLAGLIWKRREADLVLTVGLGGSVVDVRLHASDFQPLERVRWEIATERANVG